MCCGLVNIAERCDFSHRSVERGHLAVTGMHVESKKTFSSASLSPLRHNRYTS
jgi:hypothetical protein